MRSRPNTRRTATSWLATGAVWTALAAGPGAVAQAAPAPAQRHDGGVSPALCGAGDAREPGIQGEVPAGQTANYNCGVKLVGQLPIVGNVAGAGKCVYVRARGQAGTPDGSRISVID